MQQEGSGGAGSVTLALSPLPGPTEYERGSGWQPHPVVWVKTQVIHSQTDVP
jgi:hypothetical protein